MDKDTLMNNRDSVKTRMSAVEKRYGKTTKGTTPGKARPKTKVKPILSKNKLGFKVKVTF